MLRNPRKLAPAPKAQAGIWHPSLRRYIPIEEAQAFMKGEMAEYDALPRPVRDLRKALG